jgi:hypothetical protein
LKNKYYTLRKENGSYTVTLNKNPILYQYRTVNDYTVKALLNAEIWATVPTAFNDPYDSVFCYRESIIKKEIKKHIKKENFASYANIIVSPDDMPIYRISDLVDYIYLKYIGDQVKKFKESVCLACFSEVCDSEIMWAHYAKNATGFLLEYDGLELKRVAQKHRSICTKTIQQQDMLGIGSNNDAYQEPDFESLLPAIYNKGKPNREARLINFIEIFFQYCDKILIGEDFEEVKKWFYKATLASDYRTDSLKNDFHSAFACKHSSWSYEREWRIWSYNINPLIGKYEEKHVLLGYAKPQAMYLGEFISEYDEIALTEIAKNILNIPIYKMKSVMGSNNMKLVPYQI